MYDIIVEAEAPGGTEVNSDMRQSDAGSASAIGLSEQDRHFLALCLAQIEGPVRLTEEMLAALGFPVVENSWGEIRALDDTIASDASLSPVEWGRALILAELVFISEFAGVGYQWEVMTGWSHGDGVVRLRSVQQRLRGVLALPGPAAIMDPLPASAYAPARDDDEGPVSSSTIGLSALHLRLLHLGLTNVDRLSIPSDEFATALGFPSKAALVAAAPALVSAVERGQPVERIDWSRALLVTEVVFGSDCIGLGLRWAAVTGWTDAQSIEVLRQIQHLMAGFLVPIGFVIYLGDPRSGWEFRPTRGL